MSILRGMLKAAFPVLLISAGLWTLTSGFADETATQGKKPAKESARDASKESAGACLTDESVLHELARRRDELDAREKAVAAREAEVAAKDKALEEQLKKIEEVRDEIRALEAAAEAKTEENVSKLVETLEKMSPKASSKVLSNLDDRLAVVAMKRIESTRLAKIMNLMEPERSSKLSEQLAGVRRKGGAGGQVRNPSSTQSGGGN